jgi:hypothetical protein
VGRKLNGTHQLLVYADNVNVLGDNIKTIKNTEALIDASKEISQGVNKEETKYMSMSRNQIARRSHNIKMANRFF